MRIPQVTGRVRRGPGQALRAVFTGIGQMFLAADRLKEQVESAADAESGDGTAGGWSHESVRVAGSTGRGGSAGGGSAGRGSAGGARAGGKAAPGQAAGRADRSRRSASAGAGTAAQKRWRSLDTTGNVRLLSAEDLALEFPETPTAPDISVRPGRETPPQTLIVGQSPTLDRPPVANAVDGEETVDERSASDEVTDTAAAPAPVAPASEAPPTTIVIIDESLAKYEAEQAATDQSTTDEWAAAEEDAGDDGATAAEPTTSASASPKDLIVIVDDTAYDDTARDAGVSAETPVAAGTADETTALDRPVLPPDADGLPVPSYDSLSLPSLRARLRNLDIGQVRMLVEYERTHAARADVITMFERRIDKLAASQ